MRPGLLNTCLVCLYLLNSSSALTRSKEYRKLSGSEYVPADGGKPVENSYLKEPSCEELRAMWRFSKRQSRAAEITNEIPTYRDPFAYNVWEEYARPRSAGRGGRYRKPLVYGRIVHNAQHPSLADNLPDRIRAFEEVARLFGTSVHPVTGIPRRKTTSFRLGGGAGPIAQIPMHMQSGSFQHLKELIRTERARELQEQRISEEIAARAAAARMKDAGKIHFGRMVQDQEPDSSYNPDRTDEYFNDKENGEMLRSRGIVAFPDLLAPATSSRYLDDDELLTSPRRSMYKYKQRSSYPDSNTAMGEVNPESLVTW